MMEKNGVFQSGKPLAVSCLIQPEIPKNGAVDGTRTCDLRFTKALLYQLSYDG